MDKEVKEITNILAGVNAVEFFVRLKAKNAVDSVSKIHPMLRLYFDSDLNSETEKNAIMAMSEALIWSVDKFTERGQLSNFRGIGMSIAQTLSKNMYFAKLIHHANIGRISTEQFYELASEYIAAESVNVINRLWDFVGAGLPQFLSAGIQNVLESVGVTPQTAEWIAGLIDNVTNVAYLYVKKFLTEDTIKKYVYYILKKVVESARRLSIYIAETTEKVKDIYKKVESTVKSWGREICEFFKWEVPDFLTENIEEKYNPAAVVGIEGVIDKPVAVVGIEGVIDEPAAVVGIEGVIDEPVAVVGIEGVIDKPVAGVGIEGVIDKPVAGVGIEGVIDKPVAGVDTGYIIVKSNNDVDIDKDDAEVEIEK